jgi:hypothetical protein
MAAYAFDTGDDTPLLTRVAEGVLTLLEPLRLLDESDETARGPYLRTLRQLADDPDEEIINELGWESFGVLPAVHVVVADSIALSHTPSLIRWEQTIRVHVLSGVAGHLVDGRLNAEVDDTRQDPGIAVMLDHVTELLHFRKLPTCPGSGGIRMRSRRKGAVTPSWTWWFLEMAAEIQQPINHARGAVPIDAVVANHAPQARGTMVTTRKDRAP